MNDVVERTVAAELRQPVMPEAKAMADAILRAHGSAVGAILFYGSCLRSGDASGLLDFYVLLRKTGSWRPDRPLRGMFLRLLPPDVEHWSTEHDGRTIRAKVAVISCQQFAQRLQPASRDTTIWARFAQPAALLHARDDAAADWVRAALAQAVATAASWAAQLGPERGTPEAYWQALFTATYGAELRTERPGRAREVQAAAGSRYSALFLPGLARCGIAAEELPDGTVRPVLTTEQRRAAAATWRRWRRLGKWRNVARLVKAAFTFEGGADYLAWKVQRHSGIAVPLTPWQRRHPILAAPLVLWQLRRAGAVR
ncbi:hypothetical protein [Roseomonas elaeocarpi]|uniref:Phosphatidate cytidylyltransferase n=1 Tax=Roseomonas elaeocarpi TaxID=907779 RepID=A0ABV6JQN8_9PROT